MSSSNHPFLNLFTSAIIMTYCLVLLEVAIREVCACTRVRVYAFLCVYLCVYACVCSYICEDQRSVVSSLIAFHIIFWDRVSSDTRSSPIRIEWPSKKLQLSSYSQQWNWHCSCAPSCLGLYTVLGSALKSSCSHSKHFTHWIMSLTLGVSIVIVGWFVPYGCARCFLLPLLKGQI